MSGDGRVQHWRAVEALRAGVPNRDAVRAVGSTQAHIEGRFRKLLDALPEQAGQGQGSPGLLLAGAFGTGKSHLLEHLQSLALNSNFVCSKIVISKETPLFDPAKIYVAAMQSARAPGRAGAGLAEIAHNLDFASEPYRRFTQWLNRPDNGLSTNFFAATAQVFERYRGESEPEIPDRILQFWSGAALPVNRVRAWLRDMRQTAAYPVRAMTQADLALQRYRFAPQLMLAAGYSGWVLLLDEVELIRHYSTQQRARSYRELARWMGALEGVAYPGLMAVLAINSDFEARMLEEKQDMDRIPERLRAGGQHALASEAETGMRLIRREKLLLESPSQAAILEVKERVRAVYAGAYGWTPPPDHEIPDRTVLMRQHIKRWVNEWDLQRLYPDYAPNVEVTALGQEYGEDKALETPPEESPSDDEKDYEGPSAM